MPLPLDPPPVSPSRYGTAIARSDGCVDEDRIAVRSLPGRTKCAIVQAKRAACCSLPGTLLAVHNGRSWAGTSRFGRAAAGPGVASRAADKGRRVLNVQFYEFAFRVPPLRNVELTAVFPQRSFATLESVVKHYNDVRRRCARSTVDASGKPPRQLSRRCRTINAVLATLDGRAGARAFDGRPDRRSRGVPEIAHRSGSARSLGIVPASVPSGLPCADGTLKNVGRSMLRLLVEPCC